jgi:hypothetical protein
MKAVFSFLFSALFSFTAAVGQTDEYIVTTKGDTLKGDVKILTYDRLDRVQLTADKNKTIYSALQVKSIFEKGEYYRAVQIENAIQFMKILKDGYLSLLAFRMSNPTTYDGRYLSKRDGSGKELPNLGFKKVISAYLSDCPDLAKQISEDKFKRSEIEKIVTEYNLCIDQRTQVAKLAAEGKKISADKSEVINALKAKVADLEDFSGKRDVLDLLNDISEKVARQQTVSNYQLETLKGLLKEKDSVKEELEKVLSVLNSN